MKSGLTFCIKSEIKGLLCTIFRGELNQYRKEMLS
jgi:hypothetical protein